MPDASHDLPALLALAPDPTFVVDRGGRIAAVDPRIGELTGRAVAELAGAPFEALVPQAMLDPDARLTVRCADGAEIPVEISVRVVDGLLGEGAGAALAVALRDVTLRRRRAASLRASAERRRMQAAEEERARWARELHDETLQALAGLHVLLSSGARAPDEAAMRARIGLAQEQIEGAMENLRGLINDLRPAALDELGLEASVRDLAARVQTVYGIEVETRVALRGAGGGAPRRLDPDVETTAYRVVQEGLSNAARHARAGRVAVALAETAAPEPALEVRVRDDGVGFDAAAREGGASAGADGPAAPPPGAGYGLTAMRERVDLLGGELRVTSDASRGTEIAALLPLAADAEAG